MEILISNQQQKHKVNLKTIRDKAQRILSALALIDEELSLLIVDDEEIEKLNTEYRGKAKPTNVLSFPMRDGEPPYISSLLGDVVISSETNKKEADDAGITFDERFSQLLIHGILHLIGYDHELSVEDAVAMEEKSLELLKIIENNPELNAF